MLSQVYKTDLIESTPWLLQIRIVFKLIEEEEQIGGDVTSLMHFFGSCLGHPTEMVIYEAARAIVNLRRTGARELGNAISALRHFCSDAKPASRFAALRTLSNVRFLLNLYSGKEKILLDYSGVFRNLLRGG